MVTGYLDNYYARLGIAPNASPDDIRAAYHHAAKRLHPDTNHEPGATELFLQVQEAYETLSDPEKKQKYDKILPPDVTTPPDIMVNAIYSRSTLSVSDTPQLMYVMIDLMALKDKSNTAGASRAPMNVALVLDTSTSMQGPRLDAVKETATQLAQALKSEDILSIIAFNDRAEVVVPATRGLDKTKLESRISMLQTRGGTEIYMGLQAGLNEIMHNHKPSYINHMILITDGRTYGDENDCIQLADTAAKRGITISALGIGAEWNDDFLDELASRTGGSSEFANHPRTIRNFLKNKFGQISNTFAHNAQMTYATHPDFELRYAFRLAPDANEIKIEDTLALGDIPIGRSLSVILEFMAHKVDPTEDLVTLMSGNVSFNIPTRAIPDVSVKYNMRRPAVENPEQEPPPQVLVKAMSRLSLYRMQAQARQELAAGNTDKATQKLGNLATQLLNSGEVELAQTVMLEVNNIERQQNLNEEGKKRIKYGTRSLLMLPSGEE